MPRGRGQQMSTQRGEQIPPIVQRHVQHYSESHKEQVIQNMANKIYGKYDKLHGIALRNSRRIFQIAELSNFIKSRFIAMIIADPELNNKERGINEKNAGNIFDDFIKPYHMKGEGLQDIRTRFAENLF